MFKFGTKVEAAPLTHEERIISAKEKIDSAIDVFATSYTSLQAIEANIVETIASIDEKIAELNGLKESAAKELERTRQSQEKLKEFFIVE